MSHLYYGYTHGQSPLSPHNRLSHPYGYASYFAYKEEGKAPDLAKHSYYNNLPWCIAYVKLM